jgi:hypothetical protein
MKRGDYHGIPPAMELEWLTATVRQDLTAGISYVSNALYALPDRPGLYRRVARKGPSLKPASPSGVLAVWNGGVIELVRDVAILEELRQAGFPMQEAIPAGPAASEPLPAPREWDSFQNAANPHPVDAPPTREPQADPLQPGCVGVTGGEETADLFPDANIPFQPPDDPPAPAAPADGPAAEPPTSGPEGPTGLPVGRNEAAAAPADPEADDLTPAELLKRHKTGARKQRGDEWPTARGVR